MLAEQVLLLAELELDLQQTEQVLQAVELGVDLLDVLEVDLLDVLDLLDMLDLLYTLGRERARLGWSGCARNLPSLHARLANSACSCARAADEVHAVDAAAARSRSRLVGPARLPRRMRSLGEWAVVLYRGGRAAA